VKTPIDFVLPWVDSSDTKWQAERNRYKGNNSDNTDANANARFRDMETLKYALRAIEQNCPWYNNIYLITEGHVPKWLDVEHERIIHVTHQELFVDPSHLPVFNSSAIEMNLANLKGLSEQFVYMNDDFIILNAIEPKRFFQKGKPVDFFSHHFLPRNRLFERFRQRDTWVHALNNNLALINKTLAPITLKNKYLFHHSYTLSDKINNSLFRYLFKKLLWINHWHHPQPYLKRTLNEVFETFGSEMMTCSKNRFRSPSDLTQYLYRYWHLATENFTPYKYNDGLVANLDSYSILQTMIQKINTDSSINFVCFNDSVYLDDKEYHHVKEELLSFLEERFPQKASFEKV